jgi:hypothetical protein
MSYTLYKTNGNKLTTVEDGSLDSTTDLVFVGKNYSGYGAIVNQDLVKLLENFSGKLQPTKSLTGQLWYDSTNGKLKVYIGSTYKPLASIESGITQPTSSVKTDLWYDESVSKLKYFDGTNYIVIGPQISGENANNLMEVASIYDINGALHRVLQHNIQKTNGTKYTVAITSPEAFTVASTESVKSDFFYVKKGITLAGSNKDTGISPTEDSSATGVPTISLWGTSANSKLFNSYSSDQFVFNGAPGVSTPRFYSKLQIDAYEGLEIAGPGDGGTRLRTETNGSSSLSNLQPTGRLSLRVNVGSSQAGGTGLIDVITLATGEANAELDLLPSTAPGTINYTTNLGRTTLPFNNAYVRNITSVSASVTTASVTTATVRTLLPDQSNGLLNPTIGSPTQKFDTIYATNVVADSVSLIGLTVPVYANTTARDAAYVGTPASGTLILTGTKFQGYNGTAWVDLN